MICKHDGCEQFSEVDRDECYRHRIASVGFAMHGPAQQHNFHQTANDFRLKHFGTASEKELAERGIERVSS